MRYILAIAGLFSLALACNERADGARITPSGGASSPAASLDTVAEAGMGLTVIDLGLFSNLEMTSSLQIGYYPALGERAPEHTTLSYFALTESLMSIKIELPYQLQDAAALFEFSKVPVEVFPVPSYVRFETDTLEEGTRTWYARTGELRITRGGPALLDLQFGDLQVAEVLRPVATEGPLEILGDGFITGGLEQVCYEAVDVTGPVTDGSGIPNLDYRIDEAWASPFCRQVDPAAVR